MGSNVFVLSYIVLWGSVLLLYFAVYLMYRHFGRLALQSEEGRKRQGPELYKKIHQELAVVDLSGTARQIGHPEKEFQLVFFSSVDCPLCKKTIPLFRAFAEQHVDSVETILIARGDKKSVAGLASNLPGNVALVVDEINECATKWGIFTTPFVVLTDSRGIVRSKGVAGKNDFDKLSRWLRQGKRTLVDERAKVGTNVSVT